MEFVTLWLPVIGGIGFELFNIYTTAWSLGLLFGDWMLAGPLTFGIVLADIGTFTNIIRSGRDITQKPGMLAVWVITAIANAFLTWWGVAYAVETFGGTTPAELRGHGWIVPIAVAALVFFVRLGLMKNIIDALSSGTGSERTRRTTKPVSQPFVAASHTQATADTVSPALRGHTLAGSGNGNHPLERPTK